MTQKTQNASKTKLWQKAGTSINPDMAKYMVAQDLAADQSLVPYDVAGSIAHAKMLAHVGLLSADEADTLVDTLESIIPLHAAGNFVLSIDDEDMHTAIEAYLVEKLGDTGKKIHVGRSRNDQVLTAMRLYSCDMIDDTRALLKTTATTVLDFAAAHEFIPMAGYTHMQRAMPSSVGQWAGAHVESLINDLTCLNAAYTLNDQNPLGSAAGFGTAMPLDREFSTKEMDFSRVQVNPIYCQNSRGKIEGFTIGALVQIMLTLGKIANDLIVFTSKEFAYFSVDNSLTTGSSIMPQKRNLDVMEVLRANVSVVQSLQIQCQSACLNLISGYNKDLMITKTALMDAFDITQDSLKIINLMFQNITPRVDNLTKAFDDTEIYAADYANELVESGMTFRDAYREVGENLSSLEKRDAVANIKSKKHSGATGNLGLDAYRKTLID